MNRRHFLLSLPVLSLLPRLLSACEPTPSLYPVQYRTDPAGRHCTLLWDGRQHWRAEFVGRSCDYIHPCVHDGLDAEFYAASEAAQNMMHTLMEETPA